jgi:hypothetical protein
LTKEKTDDEAEVERMVNTWRKVKADFYEKGLDGIDATARSLITLSSALVTVGFSVIGAMVGYKVLESSVISLWLALCGFGFFMLSAILGVLVIFRRPIRIDQLALPREISSEWARIRSIKFRYLKSAYFVFGAGVVFVTIALFFLILLG